MIDINNFRANQSKYPREQLAKYNGQYVAWSDDGTRILAANADPATVDATLTENGFDPSEILVNLVAIPEDVAWSGWSVPEETAKSSRFSRLRLSVRKVPTAEYQRNKATQHGF